MLEFIAETLPGPSLMPDAPYDRYRARAWGQVLQLAVGPATSALGCAQHLAPELARRETGELRRSIERIDPVERRAAWLAVIDGLYDDNATSTFRERLKVPVGRIESTLARSPWLAGPAYSIADIDAYALVDPLRELAPAVVNAQSTPRIIEWLDRIAARPATRAARARARRGDPRTAFVPGVEPSRWG
jgi:glutathione S-transferase